jgi:hypothetical protein
MACHSLSGFALATDIDPTCTIWYIQRRAGITDFKSKRTVAYVTKLIEQKGFPRPLPGLNTRRAELVDEVTPRSKWQRPAVDQWFDDWLPPATTAALDEAARAAAASEMDASAANLGRLKLVGGREA